MRPAAGVGVVDLALVDAHDHLALLYAVADVEVDRNDAARDLRRDSRLLHRLDRAVEAGELVHLAIGDDFGLEILRRVRFQHGAQDDCDQGLQFHFSYPILEALI